MRHSPFAVDLAAAIIAVGAWLMAARPVQGAESAIGAPVNPGGMPATIAGPSAASTERRAAGLEVAFAVRASRIASAGFDPFSSNDGLVATTLAASYGVRTTPTFGLAAGFEWSHGAATSDIRGTRSSLDVDGLALTLKASVPLADRWAAFVRLAPGTVRLDASLEEESAAPATGSRSATRSDQTKWRPSIDVAAGAAFRLATLSDRPVAFRLWITAEGGYGYSPGYQLALGGAETATTGRSDRAIRLGTLALQGGFMRFGAALTF